MKEYVDWKAAESSLLCYCLYLWIHIVCYRNRAYFSSISILLPPSWPDKPTYEVAGNERFFNGDFLILNSFPEFEAPSVFRESTDCGTSKGHGRFAPGHFTNAESFKQFGTYEKVGLCDGFWNELMRLVLFYAIGFNLYNRK